MNRRQVLSAVTGAGVASLSGCWDMSDPATIRGINIRLINKSRETQTFQTALEYAGTDTDVLEWHSRIVEPEGRTWLVIEPPEDRVPVAHHAVVNGKTMSGTVSSYASRDDECVCLFCEYDPHSSEVGMGSSTRCNRPCETGDTEERNVPQGGIPVNISTGDVRWAFTEPNPSMYSSPTVVDDTVYVGSDDGVLWAVDAMSGEQEWTFTEPLGPVRSSPTVVDGTVFVGSNDETLYAVDAETGERQWNFETGGGVSSSPTVADGIVYVGSWDGAIHAVYTTGGQAWTFTEPSNAVHSSPTVADGTVYVSVGGTVYAIDAETGEREWAFTEASWMYSSPTVADGTVYAVGSDGALYAVYAATGEQEWVFTEPENGSANQEIRSSPTIADGTVYTAAGALYAVDAATGEEKWNASGSRVSSPTVADGTVYIGSSNTLCAVDTETGEREWECITGPANRISSSPTVADGIVYFGSNSGTLYAVEAGVAGSSEGSRVRLGTLGHHDELLTE